MAMTPMIRIRMLTLMLVRDASTMQGRYMMMDIRPTWYTMNIRAPRTRSALEPKRSSR